MRMKTKKVESSLIRLEVGVQYRAHRPMAAVDGPDTYPVTIVDMDAGREVLTIEDLTYDQANKLINKFNNGTISFSGRTW
jgi:hypothetical protein